MKAPRTPDSLVKGGCNGRPPQCTCVCGAASVASWDPLPVGPRVERHLLVKRARMEGFVVFDYNARYGEALAAVTDWVTARRIRDCAEVLHIEHAPGAIDGRYRGENLGKRLIRIAD